MAIFELVNVNYLQGLTTPLFLMYKCDQLGTCFSGSNVVSAETVVQVHGQDTFDGYFRRLDAAFNA